LGQRAAQATPHLADTTAVQGLLQPGGTLLAIDALELGAVVEIFLDAHLGVERDVVGQVADVLAHLHRLRHDIEAGDARDAAGRRQVRREDAHGRRLAGAVEAEEANDLSLVDLEADLIESQHGAEKLGDAVTLDHHGVRPVLAGAEGALENPRKRRPILYRYAGPAAVVLSGA